MLLKTLGQGAMMEMGPWILRRVHKSDLDFGVSPIPVPKDGGANYPAISLATSTANQQAITGQTTVDAALPAAAAALESGIGSQEFFAH
jgi:ABC-type glycerol-3-phosphate transport system substrate-binding protein